MRLDGNFMTDSLRIMMTLEGTFTGPNHKPMWPAEGTAENVRAQGLMRLERSLFGVWCNLVFRGAMGNEFHFTPFNAPFDSTLLHQHTFKAPYISLPFTPYNILIEVHVHNIAIYTWYLYVLCLLGNGPRRAFEETLDEVNRELSVTEGPWFLSDLTIVDLTYITHVERMCASVAYWSGFKVRGDGRWPAIERWMNAFEAMPSYMATKSDYYTHVMDIPPQYGPGYSLPGSEAMAARIDGRDGSWKLPLPPLSMSDLEPYGPHINPGDESACHEAAFKLIRNHENVMKFALRGAGQVGAKRFDAPLADPYAIPALEYQEDMDTLLKYVSHALLNGYINVPKLETSGKDSATSAALIKSLHYFRDRVGVPRDMTYPAARQLRAHLNWVAEQL